MKAINKYRNKILTIACSIEFGESYTKNFIEFLLMLYLVNHFNLPTNKSSLLVGTTLSIVHISNIVGAFIAEKYLGYFITSILGSVLMTFGSIFLCFFHGLFFLHIALGIISVSIGLILVNISSFIARHYDQEKSSHSERGFGFSLFFIFINLGGVVGGAVSTSLANKYGYNQAFYTILISNFFIIAMQIIGIIVLNKSDVLQFKINTQKITISSVIILFYIAIVIISLYFNLIADMFFIAAIILSLCILLYSYIKSEKIVNPITPSIFFILNTLYWTLGFQMFLSFELFIDKTVNKNFFGIELTTTQILSTESIAVFIFGALIGKIWLKLSKKGIITHEIDKLTISFIVLFFVFLLNFYCIKFSIHNQKVLSYWIIIGFLIMGVSDVNISVYGLSFITRVAPKKFLSLYTSIWFISVGLGAKIAGYISSKINITNNLAQNKTSMENGLKIFMALALIYTAFCLISRKTVLKNTPK